MDLVGRSISAFQILAVWPFNVIIHEDIPHHAFKLIDREESTRTIEQVSPLLYWRASLRWKEPHHACLP